VGFASADVGDFRAVLVCAIILVAVSVMSMAGIRRTAPPAEAWPGSVFDPMETQ